MDTEPIGVLLVKRDSKGDRLLFRYPFLPKSETKSWEKIKKNPYALLVTEDTLYRPQLLNNAIPGQLSEFSDDVLTALFAVKSDLSEHKFEIKINDIRFVCHPTSVQTCTSPCEEKPGSPSCILINVVFALNASADYSIVKCYYDLSRRIGITIRHEEKRCGYLAEQMKLMMSAHDMDTTRPNEIPEEVEDNAFDEILSKCSLANTLKIIYDNLCSTGAICIRLNNFIELSFCLPQKVHSVHKSNFMISPEDIEKCLQMLKPYHTLLLLVDTVSLLQSLPPDSSPSLTRLLKTYSPVKNFQVLAADADLTLAQIFNLTGHLLYWGSAIIIYPLSETNIYVVSPCANVTLNSPSVDDFAEQFPGQNLLEYMSDFSLPTTMSQKLNPLTHGEEQTELVQIVAWLLQRRLLIQLHTYIYFMPTKKGLTQPAQESPTHIRYQSLPSQRDVSEQVISDDSCSTHGRTDSDISSIFGDDIAKMPMTTFQTEANSWMNISIIGEDEKIEGFIIEDDFIANFPEEERTALLQVPASSSPEDFHLLINLLKRGYLQGSHHMEEIMYLENIRRSQLVQLLEKYRDILITSESEDPAVLLFYPSI